MPWGGYEEWRARWAVAPAHTRNRVRSAVRAGQGLRNPVEASLAAGLALTLLGAHRKILVVVPWLGGFLGTAAVAFAGTDVVVTVVSAAILTGGVWLSRLFVVGPRLRRAYIRNVAVSRAAAARSRHLRAAARKP